LMKTSSSYCFLVNMVPPQPLAARNKPKTDPVF
jgi:hypothetical protein